MYSGAVGMMGHKNKVFYSIKKQHGNENKYNIQVVIFLLQNWDVKNLHKMPQKYKRYYKPLM